jgi:UDP-N-acetylmuramoyl-L-alanyl-D-glutamate--2,6-diaminopimelate ligase
VLPAPHTTPEALDLNRILSEALGHGATEAVMEVSSHALAQERVFGVPFDVAVFTNLTRDHLDYHKTMEEYFAAKQVLFEGCGTDAPRAVVTNVDDESGAKLAEFSRKRSSVVLKYGWERGDLHAQKVEITTRGTRFDLVTPGGEIAVFSPLIGRVNVLLEGVRPRRLRRESTAWLTFREGLSGWIAGSRSRWWSTTPTPTMPCGI